jgi:hypothetical protein
MLLGRAIPHPFRSCSFCRSPALATLLWTPPVAMGMIQRHSVNWWEPPGQSTDLTSRRPLSIARKTGCSARNSQTKCAAAPYACTVCRRCEMHGSGATRLLKEQARQPEAKRVLARERSCLHTPCSADAAMTNTTLRPCLLCTAIQLRCPGAASGAHACTRFQVHRVCHENTSYSQLVYNHSTSPAGCARCDTT